MCPFTFFSSFNNPIYIHLDNLYINSCVYFYCRTEEWEDFEDHEPDSVPLGRVGRIAPKGATNINKLNAQERDRERERERDRGDRDRDRDDDDSMDQSASRVAGEITSGR